MAAEIAEASSSASPTTSNPSPWRKGTLIRNGATDLIGQTAVDLVERVRSGKVSPVEVVRAHLGQIDAIETRIGAFELVRAEKALTEAEEVGKRADLADLPLAGLPIAIKDNIPVGGEPKRDTRRRGVP